MKIYKTTNGVLSDIQINEIYSALCQGAIIGFPTETVYGVGCLVTQQPAIDRIYEIKNRASSKPLSLHISSPDIVRKYITTLPEFYSACIDTFWPGPVTIILKNDAGKTVGFRYPDCPVTLQIIHACGDEIFGTSANLSGTQSPKTAEEVITAFPHLDIVIDDGPCQYGVDSTIVSFDADSAEIIRAGALQEEVTAFIHAMKQKKQQRLKHILFVCTGNTCRSPMGESWLVHELRRLKKDDQYVVQSCGVCACDGMSISRGAIQCLEKHGISAASKVSQSITKALIDESDLIFCMSYSHKKSMMDLSATADEKIIVLDVEDPVGLGAVVYERCYASIVAGLQKYMKRILEGS